MGQDEFLCTTGNFCDSALNRINFQLQWSRCRYSTVSTYMPKHQYTPRSGNHAYVGNCVI